MTPRPRRPHPDSNQRKIVADLRFADLRFVGCRVIDVSALPGSSQKMTQEDIYKVEVGDKLENPLDLFVLSPCGRHWLQCEVKASITSKFQLAQIAYLRSLGIWPPEIPSAIPVLVIHSAEDALRWFVLRCGCQDCRYTLIKFREKGEQK